MSDVTETLISVHTETRDEDEPQPRSAREILDYDDDDDDHDDGVLTEVLVDGILEPRHSKWPITRVTLIGRVTIQARYRARVCSRADGTTVYFWAT